MTKRVVPWTRQGRFLRALALNGCVAMAARAAGIDKRTAYRWRRAKPDFARRWEFAQLKGIDAVEDEAIRRTLNGQPRAVRRRKGPTAALLQAQRALLAKWAADFWTPHRRF